MVRDASEYFLGPLGKRRLRVLRMREKYFREKVLPLVHVAVKHRGVAVLVLPAFCVGRSFRLREVRK